MKAQAPGVDLSLNKADIRGALVTLEARTGRRVEFQA